MILYQYKCECGNVFEELKEIDHRHIATCPECDQTAFKTMNGSSHNTNFKPRWYYNITTVPVYVESRNELTKICNAMGNYSNFPLAKREVMEIKQPGPQEKRKVRRQLLQHGKLI